MKKTNSYRIKLIFLASLLLSLTTALEGCTAPLILAGGAAGMGYYLGSERRDLETIEQDEKAEKTMIDLMKKSGIDTENVLVRVFNHKMLLLGRVPTSEQVSRLSHLVHEIHSVHDVYNRVEVGPPLTNSQKTKDVLLAAKIKAALIAEKGLNSTLFKYEVFNGNVYVMGLVTPKEAQKALAVIRKVKGVKKVIDAMERL